MTETKPDYYKTAGDQNTDLIDLMESGLLTDQQTIGFLQGNVMKYLMRWQWKNGLADLKKAREYLDRLIELEENTRSEDGGR